MAWEIERKYGERRTCRVLLLSICLRYGMSLVLDVPGMNICMIRINQLRLGLEHNEQDILKKMEKVLKVSSDHIIEYKIRKKSIDARKKNDIHYSYCIDVKIEQENKVLKRAANKNVMPVNEKVYEFPENGKIRQMYRPVIIGSGPAGLFCAYMLAKHGYSPIVLERGASVEERAEKVERFWKEGILDFDSNVQFGEGGAGTFSDGKLNTLVKDPKGRNRKVLEIFAEAGAPEEILYLNKPHIGTDILRKIVTNLRSLIIEMGGEVRFHSKVTDFRIEQGELKELTVNGTEKIPVQNVVLAIGHSARDTFEILNSKQVSMEPKSFAVGVRVEHPQKSVNEAQYGKECGRLPAADYSLANTSGNGRGVYSFCMCPGGYVVNASSEEGRLAVNGMSYHARASENANSAIIVSVSPEDYGEEGALAGVTFQRKLEEAAFLAGGGKIPVQLFGDFEANRVSKEFGEIKPVTKGETAFANLRDVLPDYISEALIEGIKSFEFKIKGFSRPDTVLLGIESRTSSPVRIVRDKGMKSDIRGLYPCGEGAGYAGGITSAAMDGLKAAEAIAAEFAPVSDGRNKGGNNSDN